MNGPGYTNPPRYSIGKLGLFDDQFRRYHFLRRFHFTFGSFGDGRGTPSATVNRSAPSARGTVAALRRIPVGSLRVFLTRPRTEATNDERARIYQSTPL